MRAGWGFTGLVPSRVVDVNDFGNLLIEDTSGRIWRICPEELSCAPVVAAAQELDDLILLDDWKIERLVAIATAKLGVLSEGRCFCLKVPAVLGGRYSADNFAMMGLAELIVVSGDVASQVKDLPDGAQIQFSIGD